MKAILFTAVLVVSQAVAMDDGQVTIVCRDTPEATARAILNAAHQLQLQKQQLLNDMSACPTGVIYTVDPRELSPGTLGMLVLAGRFQLDKEAALKDQAMAVQELKKLGVRGPIKPKL